MLPPDQLGLPTPIPQETFMPRRHLLAASAALSMMLATTVAVGAQEERPLGPPDATPNPVPLEVPAGDGTAVRFVTELGDIVIGLFNESAPVAAENFLNLARAGFYDGVGFHRAVPGFVLQGGDPDGTGSGGPGYTIEDEEVVGQYGRGVVAMARTQAPDSQGSQFFIVLDDAAEPALEAYRTYVIFGRVVEGMDVVDAIVEAREPSDQIADPVRIIETSIEQVELPPEPTPAPPTPAELAADELAAMLPETAGGYELQSIVLTLEDIGAELDRDVLAELQALADESGADLSLFAIAQAGGGDAEGFVNVAAVRIPGVQGELAESAASKLLLPELDLEAMPEQTFGERTAREVDLGDGRTAYVFSSDDVVWFVASDLEDATSVITALP
jgi:cyclophilin family peptidyl-prolyl cis-trans isomerase